MQHLGYVQPEKQTVEGRADTAAGAAMGRDLSQISHRLTGRHWTVASMRTPGRTLTCGFGFRRTSTPSCDKPGRDEAASADRQGSPACRLSVVGLPAPRLGEPAAYQVTNGQNDDVQPRPIGPEIVPMGCGRPHDGRCDQDRGNGS